MSSQQDDRSENITTSPGRRAVVAALGGGAFLGLAGCLGRSPGGGETTSRTRTGTTPEPATSHERTEGTTPRPAGPIVFPEGPKAPPSTPSTLEESAVRTFAETYERRLVYNRLYIDEHGSVHVTCTVHSATDDGTAWRVVVSCEGTARHPERTEGGDAEAATAVTRDRILQYYTYVVTETTARRRESTAVERP